MKINKKIIISASLVIILIISVALFFNFKQTENGVILTDEFNSLTDWKIYDYENDYFNNNVSDVAVISNGYNNGNSVFIQNRELNDTRIYKEINVTPKSYYKISFMLKSAKSSEEGIGANLSAIDCIETFVVDDTLNEWEEEEFYIETSEKQNKINWGDFAILDRSRTHRGIITKYLSYFKNLNI